MLTATPQYANEPNPKAITPIERKVAAPSRSGSGAEGWRGAVRSEMKQQDVWNQETENLIVRIIHKESTGRPDARNGQHLGLVQFNNNWGSAEKRLDPHWSIARIVRVYKEAGYSGLERHWLRWQ